jgi:hypothetical protein
MELFLTGYEVSHTTWFYLSFLLVVAVFFRFHRVWSLRNLDLALLLAIAPGILLLKEAQRIEAEGLLLFAETDRLDLLARAETFKVSGYSVLLGVTALVLVRLFCDSLFHRRPRLEQNLNNAGLVFLGISSFAFLVTSAFRLTVMPPMVTDFLRPPTTALALDESMTVRVAAILSHLAVVLGLFQIGWRHFRDAGGGVAMATLYVLLPPTSTAVAEVNHVLPAALVVWAFASVHRPILAGLLLGLACGIQVFALFLLPLWCTWFGRKGVGRFLIAWGVSLVVVASAVVITARNSEAMALALARAVDWAWLFTVDYRDGQGFWNIQHAAYRIPAFVGFLVVLATLTLWPISKNLDQLIARSAAVVVGTQFWYPQQGGTYVLWYLPLVLLVVFRPSLDRVFFEKPAEEQVHREDTPSQTPTPAPVGGTGRYVFR